MLCRTFGNVLVPSPVWGGLTGGLQAGRKRNRIIQKSDIRMQKAEMPDDGKLMAVSGGLACA